MRTRLPGFTLIELLVSIGLISALVTLGISAYYQSQKRQNIRASVNQIINTLESAQKRAQVGDRDCTGAFQGYLAALTDSSITLTAICQDGPGSPQSFGLTNLTFASSYSLTFQPLARGINIGSGADSLNIDFLDDSGGSHQIIVTKTGTIEYEEN